MSSLYTLACLVCAGCGLALAAPSAYSGTLTAFNGDHRQTFHIPRHSAFTGSLGETILADPAYSRRNPLYNDLRTESLGPYTANMNHNEGNNDGALVRKRRLADDKKLDLKMKLQRVKKVVSLDAIGSYSIFRGETGKTSLKAFGSTELWYDGTGFGLKKPGLGLQFTMYY